MALTNPKLGSTLEILLTQGKPLAALEALLGSFDLKTIFSHKNLLQENIATYYGNQFILGRINDIEADESFAKNMLSEAMDLSANPHSHIQGIQTPPFETYQQQINQLTPLQGSVTQFTVHEQRRQAALETFTNDIKVITQQAKEIAERHGSMTTQDELDEAMRDTLLNPKQNNSITEDNNNRTIYANGGPLKNIRISTVNAMGEKNNAKVELKKDLQSLDTALQQACKKHQDALNNINAQAKSGLNVKQLQERKEFVNRIVQISSLSKHAMAQAINKEKSSGNQSEARTPQFGA